MNVPLNNKSVLLGGAIAPLLKTESPSMEGKGANKITALHAPTPENATLNKKKSFKEGEPHILGGELLDKIKFGTGKGNKRENIKFIF